MNRKYIWNDPPAHTAFPVARAGYGFIIAAAFTTAVFALLELTFPAILGLLVTFSIFMFFRDPDRVIPADPGAVVSPADGKVVFAGAEENNPFMEGPCMKVSVFMSVLNVHINRIPYEGVVKKVDYYPGKFFNAAFDKASKFNEKNVVFLETETGGEICFVQIAGLIARRIICYVQPGDQVKRGQRMGLICFGSRVDVYLPAHARLSVSTGDRVQGGNSVLGYLSDGSE